MRGESASAPLEVILSRLSTARSTPPALMLSAFGEKGNQLLLLLACLDSHHFGIDLKHRGRRSSCVIMSAKEWKEAMSSGRLWNFANRSFIWNPLLSGLTSTDCTVCP